MQVHELVVDRPERAIFILSPLSKPLSRQVQIAIVGLAPPGLVQIAIEISAAAAAAAAAAGHAKYFKH